MRHQSIDHQKTWYRIELSCLTMLVLPPLYPLPKLIVYRLYPSWSTLTVMFLYLFCIIMIDHLLFVGHPNSALFVACPFYNNRIYRAYVKHDWIFARDLKIRKKNEKLKPSFCLWSLLKNCTVKPSSNSKTNMTNIRFLLLVQQSVGSSTRHQERML